MKAVIYARVSSSEQAKEGFSIPAQLKLLQSYAEGKKITIEHEFIDIETAKKTGRVNFDEMIQYLKKNSSVKIILVEKTDRLYRNIKDWVTLDDLIERDELGREVHLVKENLIISKDSRSTDKLLHGLKVVIAKNFIDNLSEETRKGLLEKAEQGIYPCYAPIGYLNVCTNGRKYLEPDPAYTSSVKDMFLLYSTGEYSLESLTKRMIDDGFRYPRSGNKMQKSMIYRMLRNPLYYGEFIWKGKLYKGTHKPIVSKELWQKVQDVLDGKVSRHMDSNNHEFPYTGLIKCGKCGCAFTAEIKKGKYVYYHCSGSKGKCKEPYVRAEKLEELLTDVICQLQIDEKVSDWIKTALRSSHQDKKAFQDEKIAELTTRYKKLQNRLDGLYEDKLDNVISEETFTEKNSLWRSEQEQILKKIKVHQNADENYFEFGSVIFELAERAASRYSHQSPHEKAKMLKILSSNLIFTEGRLIPEWRKPFDLLASVNEWYQGDEEAIEEKLAENKNWLQR